MNRSVATILYSFAGMLLVLGLASGFYNPDHSFGFNEKGRSGLIICGVAALVSIVLGFLADKGLTWTLYAGLALSFMMVAMPGSRFFIAGREWADGNSAKWLSTVILGCAALAGLRTFVALAGIARSGTKP